MFDVAVITPVFNTQDYLHRCVNSVLSQKGVSLQHIIIDDGSTDNSADIARHYKHRDDRVSFISKKNEGQGIARNVGMGIADAEFLYFVDSDDYLGEGALARLVKSARENNLDICSPAVPGHYFSKPLEYTACLPSKSQFIRSDIVRTYQIQQPAVSSGQDGVFSHLVLAHVRRIGMNSEATFHYTHAREGSTFAKHLKRHDLVAGIVQQHYDAIVAHYDKHDLWSRNGLRLLNFISDETLRNRVGPHFDGLSREDRIVVFELLRSIAERAMQHVPARFKDHVPADVAELLRRGKEGLINDRGRELFQMNANPVFAKNDNFKRGALTVCKIADPFFAPPEVKHASRVAPAAREVPAIVDTPRAPTPIPSAPVPSIPVPSAPVSSDAIVSLSRQVRELEAKLDFAINTINNMAVQIKSQMGIGDVTLEGGVPGLVGSVTTIPSRLPLVHLAIESIFAQTLRPSRIVLWISDKMDMSLAETPALQNLKRRGLEIRPVPDVGPHTKLIYALQAFPEASVFTFDDDIIYPVNMVHTLWSHHLKYPKAIISNWARELAFDEAGRVMGVRSGRLLTPANLEKDIEQAQRYEPEVTMKGFPYGTSGVLYPPGSLHEKVQDVALFRKLCPKADDIWFRAMGILQGTPVVPTNLGINPKHHCVTGSQAEALRHDNHGEQQNVLQMRQVFEALDLYSRLM